MKEKTDMEEEVTTVKQLPSYFTSVAKVHAKAKTLSKSILT
jgi:hypothetical protein